MKKIRFIFAALLITSGFISCSDDMQQQAEPESYAKLTGKMPPERVAQTLEFKNFREAFSVLLKEHTAKKENAPSSLINESNAHLLINESKALLTATGYTENFDPDNVVTIMLALDIYAQKTQITSNQ